MKGADFHPTRIVNTLKDMIVKPDNLKVDAEKDLENLQNALKDLKQAGEILKTKGGDNFNEVKNYVEKLKAIQNTAFAAASKTGYCYICHSYPHRPTEAKGYCSRCGNRP